MNCDLSFDSTSPVVGILDPITSSQILNIVVSGTVTDCDQLQVTISGNTPTAFNSTVVAEITGNSWQATFQYNTHFPKDILCDTPITVVAVCANDEDCKINDEIALQCRSETEPTQCPQLDVNSYAAGDICTDSLVASYRKLHINGTINWSNTSLSEINLTVRVWPTADTSFITEETLTLTNAQTSFTHNDFVDPVNLIAGFEYTGEVQISTPTNCTNPITLAPFFVPECCEDPEPPIDFLQVTLPDGTSVEDPNNTCVDADEVIVTAPAWEGDLAWSVNNGQEIVPFTELDEPERSIQIALPADGTEITVQAEVGNGNCIVTRVVTIERCPTEEPSEPSCEEVPTNYALIVRDVDGQLIQNGSCVETEKAIVAAPPFEGDVIWQVNSQPPEANAIDPENPRILRIILPQPGTIVTVSAIVGEGECAKTVTRTVRRCDCPEMTNLVVGGCIPGTVTITAQGNDLSAAESFEWDFGDGVQASTNSPTVTHAYSGTTALVVTVKMNAPDECESSEISTTVPVCTTPTITIDWPCLIWLITNIGLTIITAIAIFVAACLFNPVVLATGPVATWLIVVFVIALVIAIIGGIVSIISWILWMIICGAKPNWCAILIWIHDIFVILSALAWVFGIFLIFIPNSWSCGMGLMIDGGYFGLIASISEIVIRVAGCPIGRNGIIGLIVWFFEWLGELTGN